MFCYKCGKQIRNDAQFCQFCGAQQKVNDNLIALAKSTHSSNPNGELNRDALKIYLGNILSLEYLKAYYERTIGALRYKINNLNDNYLKRYILRESNSGHKKYCVHFRYNGYIQIAWFKSGESYGPYCYDNLMGNRWQWGLIESDSDTKFLRSSSQWSNFDDYDSFFLDRWAQRDEAKEAFFRAYEEFKEEAPLIYQSNVRNNRISAEIWESQINDMTKELETIEHLLKQAYDANIIPSQFRYSIHAIYYLNEFITTSNESFSTALLHFDLDEIKRKLDEVISQQETIIIQNAVTTAQSSKLLEQNQKQLEHLSRIESNSTQAVQYARIAANNAETCAWISMAKYIDT